MPKTRSKHSHPLPPSSSSVSSIPSTFTDSLPLPTLLIFDLDYTLWPFWVDTHVSSPLKPAISATASSQSTWNPSGLSSINTKMLDRWGESYSFYGEVPGILAAAREEGVVMSLASRTHAPELAGDMLRGLQVPISVDGGKEDGNIKAMRAWDFFTCPQIYPGSKTTHFRRIQRELANAKSSSHPTGMGSGHGRKQGQVQGRTIPFDEMLFFDDEGRNRNVEMELGVTFWLVPDGVSGDEVDRGVWEWRRRRGITPKDLSRGDREGEEVAELEG